MFKIEEISYHALLSAWPELTGAEICFLKDWSKIISGLTYYSITFEKTKIITGAFCLYSSKRKGMVHVSNPPFFQSCGLVIKNEKIKIYEKQSLDKRVLKSFGEFIDKFNWLNISLPYKITDTQSFIWIGLAVSPRYTYLLDISEGKEDISRNFSKGLKNDLSKISQCTIQTSNELDTSDIDFLFDTSASHRVESEQNIWRNLIAELRHSASMISTKVSFESYKGVVCIAQVGDSGVYMFGNSDKDATLALNSAALMESIDILRRRGVRHLDFEGSMIPGIERYFRSFGGKLTPYYNIVKEPKLIRTAKLLKG